jgi:hypothetical protein
LKQNTLKDIKSILNLMMAKPKQLTLLWGEIFIPLKNIDYFKKFKLNPFTIEWENGADFAPEFLYNFEESINDKATVPQFQDNK